MAILGIGVVIVWVAITLRWLTRSGAASAVIVGAALVAGLRLPGLAMLVVFFISSSWLTAICRRDGSRKPPRAPSDADASGRSAGQVFANAGVAAAAALLSWAGWVDGAVAAGGALAAATADTWSSEIGQWARGRTILVTTGETVDPGTDGGVSWAGTLAGLAGAGALAITGALTLGVGAVWVAIAAGGAVGMLVDSLLGAACEGRSAFLTNDLVNLGGTLAGALTAVLLS